MKKLLTIIFVTILFGKAYAPVGYSSLTIPEGEVIQPYEKLWQSVCFVESNNDCFAVNKKEGAYGIAQIRKIRLRDYAKRTGIHYTLKDCFDKEISKRVFMYYANSDFERVAKSWNGSGVKTEEYWRKVESKLKEL